MSVSVKLSSAAPAVGAQEATLVFLSKGETRPRRLPRSVVAAVEKALKETRFRGNAGEVKRVPVAVKGGITEVLVAGLGDPDLLCAEELLKSVATGVRSANSLAKKALAIALPKTGRAIKADAALELVARASRLANYKFDKYVSDSKPAALKSVTVHLEKSPTASQRKALKRAQILAECIGLARDLVNEPPEALNPKTMVTHARRVARGAGITARVFGKAEIEKKRMHALLSVGRGSAVQPRVIHLTYKPKGKARAKLVLVGKGVTFDSGGYNLKGSPHISHMKCDMGGSAAVLAAVSAIAQLELPVEVHGLLGMVENLISGNAYKPDDILNSRSGKSIEIINTDAEGRLVMADLLDYATTEIKPDLMLDLATLTGSCVVALGPSSTGVMSHDDELAEAVIDSATAAGEKMWRLPLYREYRAQLDSPVADIKNAGSRYGGALTAGLFLSEFVGSNVRWAHLDIAGPAFRNQRHAYHGLGGTGAGVATLVEWVASL